LALTQLVHACPYGADVLLNLVPSITGFGVHTSTMVSEGETSCAGVKVLQVRFVRFLTRDEGEAGSPAVAEKGAIIGSLTFVSTAKPVRLRHRNSIHYQQLHPCRMASIKLFCRSEYL